MTDLEFVRQAVARHAGAILDANDAIWGYAELAFHETKSAALLEKLLEENGFTVQTGLAGIPTCFTGTYVKGSGKPVMGVLGEFDALSSLSQQAATPEKIPVQEGAPGRLRPLCAGHRRAGGGLRHQGLSGRLRRGRHHHLLRLPCRGGRRQQAVHGPGGAV